MTDKNNEELIIPDELIISDREEISNINSMLITKEVPISELKRMVNEAEERINLVNMLREKSLKVTKIWQWVNYSNQPYVMKAGAFEIGKFWGIKIIPLGKPDFKQLQDEKGTYYVVTHYGIATWGNFQIAIEGSCSSRDKLYGWIASSKEYKALGDVDYRKIEAKSFTHMRRKGVVDITSIEGLPWDYWERITGFKQKDLPRVGEGSYSKSESPTPLRKKAITKNGADLISFWGNLKKNTGISPSEFGNEIGEFAMRIMNKRISEMNQVELDKFLQELMGMGEEALREQLMQIREQLNQSNLPMEDK